MPILSPVTTTAAVWVTFMIHLQECIAMQNQDNGNVTPIFIQQHEFEAT